MDISTVTGQLPRHQYVWIDTNFTHKKPHGFIPAVWFGLVSMPGRAWGCTVMLECGAIYRNIPPHAISFKEHPTDKVWTIKDAQKWDCYGQQFHAHVYNYLDGLECKAKTNGKELIGEYLFSVAPVGDAFSHYPNQAKEFTFVWLKNDRLTIQPTDFLVFKESSFTDDKMEFPVGIKRQNEFYYCE